MGSGVSRGGVRGLNYPPEMSVKLKKTSNNSKKIHSIIALCANNKIKNI